MRAFWRRHRAVVRAWLVFLPALAAGMLVLDGNREFVEGPLVHWNAKLTAWSLSLLGARGVANGGTVLSDMAPIRVIGECTAAPLMAIFVAAVLSFPCRPRAKALGLVLGIPALMVLNVVRLVSLAAIGDWFPAYLDIAHWLVWQSLLVFATVFLWVLWAGLLTGARDAAA